MSHIGSDKALKQDRSLASQLPFFVHQQLGVRSALASQCRPARKWPSSC